MGQNGAECMPRYRVPRLAWFSRGKLKHVEMKLQVLVDQQYYLGVDIRVYTSSTSTKVPIWWIHSSDRPWHSDVADAVDTGQASRT